MLKKSKIDELDGKNKIKLGGTFDIDKINRIWKFKINLKKINRYNSNNRYNRLNNNIY